MADSLAQKIQRRKESFNAQLLISTQQAHVIKDADIDPIHNRILFGLGNSLQEKKQRRKELIRVYKQKRELNNTEQETHSFKQTNAEAYSDALAVARPQKMLENENILDSKVFEQRPKINTTLEKRKLSAYSNIDSISKVPHPSKTQPKEENKLLNFLRKASEKSKQTKA